MSEAQRLIAIDLDGTLLTRDKRISPRTRAALEAAAVAGCLVVIATGRGFDVLRLFCAGLPLNAPQITYNGAVVHDPVTRQDIYRQLVPSRDTGPVVDFLLDRGIPVAYFTPGTLYMDRRIPRPELWLPPPLAPPTQIDDPRRVAGRPCIKVVGSSDRQAIAQARGVAMEQFGTSLYVTQTADDLLEFLHPAVSKGAALRRIAHMLGIAREEIVAFGDSHNDIEMLQFAGVGVAMGNAADEVKAIADLVTDTNRADGVATALARLGIIPP